MRFEERSILKSSKILFPRVEIKFERCFLRTLGPDLPPSCSNHRHRIFATMSTLYRKYVDSGRRATRGSGDEGWPDLPSPPVSRLVPLFWAWRTVETEKANLSIIETTNGSRSSSRFEIKISEFRKLFSPGFLKSFSVIFSVIFSMFLLPLGIEYF